MTSHSPSNSPKALAALVFFCVLAALAAAFIPYGKPSTAPHASSGPGVAFAEDAGGAHASKPAFWPQEAKAESDAWTGRLVRVDEHLAILSVRGTPEQRGAAHGKLLRAEVRRLVSSVNKYLTPSNDERGKQQFETCLKGARVMKKYLEADVLVELDACAKAAEVDADELLLAQLFGDVNRAKGFASFCSSFAAFGPATKDGKPVVGRNFDYAGHGLEGGLPLILQELPTGAGAGHAFVTIGYAGILNGWTALNAEGIFASNNTLFGGADKLEGISTCFLLRKIVERAGTVEEGVALVEKGPRACTTGMLIAGKNRSGTWDARFAEFDAEKVAVLDPVDGLVMGTNTRQKLAVSTLAPSADPGCGRYQTLKKYVRDRKGGLDFGDLKQNPIGAKDVYMSINLHSALLDLEGQRFRLAVSPGDNTPAAEHPFRVFKIEKDKVVEVSPESLQP
ncbi:MAG: hypothetical protein HY291_22855 [Planctomycetes bacterium]|nr:hypothetical protein [Planctomycetota bacterium]